MDKRRRAAFSATGHALIAAVGAASGALLGAISADVLLHGDAGRAAATAPAAGAQAAGALPATWPLPDGGFVTHAVQTDESDPGDCVISRTGANGEWLWRQHLPAACVIYGVDASGGTWVASDGVYRVAPDGTARRMDVRLRDAATFLFASTPVAMQTTASR